MLGQPTAPDECMNWQSHLEQWITAGVVDSSTADRIRRWEQEHHGSGRLRWPVLIAIVFGALLLCAGILLFVSAHWDELSPTGRMSIVLLMVGIFHAGGAAVADRFNGLSIALHTAGSVALGGGIALTGQIFHLSEHWPAAILLWGAGTALAWLLLGHWTQGALTAILLPYWLAGEWSVHVMEDRSYFRLPIYVGICALSFTYLSARRGPEDGALRKALGWIGGIALIPASALAAMPQSWSKAPTWQTQLIVWSIVAIVSVALALLLRGRDAVWTAGGIVWSLLFVAANRGYGEQTAVYLHCALGAAWLTYWGIRDSRPERINLGIAGFAITVIGFYFSSVMDKLGRSASLIVAGLLLLGGGWLLEHTRRQLLGRLTNQEAK